MKNFFENELNFHTFHHIVISNVVITVLNLVLNFLTVMF